MSRSAPADAGAASASPYRILASCNFITCLGLATPFEISVVPLESDVCNVLKQVQLDDDDEEVDLEELRRNFLPRRVTAQRVTIGSTAAHRYIAAAWALNDSVKYTVTVHVSREQEGLLAAEQQASTGGDAPPVALQIVELDSNASPFAKGKCPPTFISEAHMAHPLWAQCIAAQGSEQSMLVIIRPNAPVLPLLDRLCFDGLFLLPHESSPIALVPNGAQRFCFAPLRPETAWDRSRKMRRALGDFSVVVNRSVTESLQMAAKYHTARVSSTWLTPAFIAMLTQLHGARGKPNIRCTLHVFELIDSKTGDVLAATFGVAAGSCFMDFTMCTPLQDRRGCGTILSKIVGDILTKAGFRLWYWGHKLPYMLDFRRYGARDVTRDECCDLWNAARSLSPTMDPAQVIAEGRALVPERVVV